MNILKSVRYWNNQPNGSRKPSMIRQLVLWLILSAVILSCKPDAHSSSWFDDSSLTISQYLEKNQHVYSKFYRLLIDGKMLPALYAYNPNGDGYTLFLPTDEAIDHFIEQNQKYANFEELLKDTSFIKILTRYHTLKRKIRTDDFPDGVLADSTLMGNRLVASFFAFDNKQLIKMNNVAPIVRPNLDMINGYIHVVSEVLPPVTSSGYEWLHQHENYSILAKAMELSGIPKKLKWDNYTLLAEPDSVYNRYGIYNVEDLISRFATPGVSLTSISNPFYQFTAYHILKEEYYTNDLAWGSKKYITLSDQLITISVGQVIKINTGVDTYGTVLSESGDTTLIDYIRPISESGNIPTTTGPIHSISDLLYFKKLPAVPK